MPAQITVSVAGSERSVPAGTTGADLFEAEKNVVVCRVDGELRDLATVLADGDVVEPVPIDSPDGLTSCGTRPPTCWRRPCSRSSRGPARHRAADRATASTTTSTSPSRSRRRTSSELEKRMRKIVKEGQRFSGAWSPTTRRARGARRRAVQARADRPQGRQRPPSDGRGRRRRGRRRRADHLRQPRRRDGGESPGGPVPRAAPADHQAASRRSS